MNPSITRRCSELQRLVHTFIPLQHCWGALLKPHFPGEDTEAQRDWGTCSRSHSCEPGLGPQWVSWSPFPPHTLPPCRARPLLQAAQTRRGSGGPLSAGSLPTEPPQGQGSRLPSLTCSCCWVGLGLGPASAQLSPLAEKSEGKIN